MIEMNKRYRTRDGKSVRVLANDINTNDTQPVLFAYTEVIHYTRECIAWAHLDGSRYSGEDNALDLVEITEDEQDRKHKHGDPECMCPGCYGSYT